MRVGLDLDKTLLLSALPYEFVDANEKMLESNCSYGHLLYNEKRTINTELVKRIISVRQKYVSLVEVGVFEIIILTGSWVRNIPKTYSKFLEGIFPGIDVKLLSNPCKYISEESIALFKADEIISNDIEIYIDDDKSISEKIQKLLNYNGYTVKRDEWKCTEDCTLYTTYLDNDSGIEKLVNLMGIGSVDDIDEVPF